MFNPPWNAAVSTNVAARFLKLIDKHFDKQSAFHKNFNRQTVKVSYSCMPNMASIISSHNRRVTGAAEEHVEGGCNCRNGQASCVLQGHCLTPNVVYKCAVSTHQECKEYIGLTSNTFKERYYAHSNSVNKESSANSTSLSTHTWELKNNPKENRDQKEFFGFRSTNNPPQLRELKPFENNLFNLIYSIKYKPAHNKFQEQLKKDKLQIINNPKVIVGADKTTNLYKIEVDHYNKKVMESITK